MPLKIRVKVQGSRFKVDEFAEESFSPPLVGRD
jgi:hypothetical protein